MKAKTEQSSTKKPNNKVGNKINEQNRKAAMQVMPKAVEVESMRNQNGYIWIKKGKTRKQVNPQRLNSYINDGWVKTGLNA